MAERVKRKRVKLREGDVLELGLPDRRLGYGVIVDRGVLPSGGAPYIVVFASAYETRPNVTELESASVALVGWTTDALVYHDEWKIVGHDFPIPVVPFPNFKVRQRDKFYVTDFRGRFIDLATPQELDLLDFRPSFSPLTIQKAFEALHGFGEWDQDYERLTPAHARARMTRHNLRTVEWQ